MSIEDFCGLKELAIKIPIHFIYFFEVLSFEITYTAIKNVFITDI